MSAEARYLQKPRVEEVLMRHRSCGSYQASLQTMQSKPNIHLTFFVSFMAYLASLQDNESRAQHIQSYSHLKDQIEHKASNTCRIWEGGAYA